VEHVPSARLAIVGFGSYHAAALRLVGALSVGDLSAVRDLAATGRAAEGAPASRLAFGVAFLDWLEASGEAERYLAVARGMRKRVVFVGRLEHDELADFLPLCETVVVPSTFPEAFGMVAVEAAACGVLPITAAHSGLSEVSHVLAETLPQPVRELASFAIGPDAVRSIATCVIGYLCTTPDVHDAVRTELVRTIETRYSWVAAARGAIAAARGCLDALERPY
jgi:glycosyltransferase involved in cell wall biosynthesis